MDYEDCNLLNIWSYDLVVVVDLQGSMVEIGELNDVVVEDVVNVQEEVHVHNGVLNLYVIYLHIIS